MTITSLLVIIAAVLAVVDIFEARGRSYVGWAVLLLCIAVLWSVRL